MRKTDSVNPSFCSKNVEACLRSICDRGTCYSFECFKYYSHVNSAIFLLVLIVLVV